MVVVPPKRLRSIAELPGPRALPLFGNALTVNPKKLHLTIERWAKRYGTLYAFRLFRRNVVVVSDPALIQAVLRDRPATFRRMATINDVLAEVGADGVFSAEGEAWRLQRQAIVPALDAKHVRTFFPLLRDITLRLKRRWEHAATSNVPLDVLSDLSRFTVDVTTSFAFGYDVDSLQHDEDVLQRHLARLFPAINRRLNAPLPYWRYIKLPADRAAEASVSYVRTRLETMIDEARRRLATRPVDDRPRNFIEAVLSEPTGGRPALSAKELSGNAMTLLGAGEDTTASTLAWTLWLIAGNPSVQSRLQAEADAILGDEAVLADIDAARALVYHEAVITESLRLKPVVPLFFLEANVTTELGGVRIPAGTTIFLATRARDLAERAGGNEFAPERHLAESDGTRRFGDFSFGAGPRLCPGRNLAVLEMKAALSMIAKTFTLAPAPGDVYEEFSFVMVPRNLRLLLRKRAAQAGASAPST
jgi:cytochrome P450